MEKENLSEYLVYHPLTNRVMMCPITDGLYQHVEVVTMNMVNYGWNWESEGDFIAHD